MAVVTLQLTGPSKPGALVTGMCSRLRLPQSLCEKWALTRAMDCPFKEGRQRGVFFALPHADYTGSTGARGSFGKHD